MYTATSAAEDISTPFGESNSADTDHKSQSHSETVANSSPNMRSKIDFELNNFGLVKKSHV